MIANNLSIALLGTGVMGEAFIAGLLRNDLARGDQIIASDPLQTRRDTLEALYGIRTHHENAAAVQSADVVIVAIKPQHLEKVLADLKQKVKPGTLVLSIVAGANTELIGNRLNHQSIVRVMPNTPANIGFGISVWTASDGFTAQQKELARQKLSA